MYSWHSAFHFRYFAPPAKPLAFLGSNFDGFGTSPSLNALNQAVLTSLSHALLATLNCALLTIMNQGLTALNQDSLNALNRASLNALNRAWLRALNNCCSLNPVIIFARVSPRLLVYDVGSAVPQAPPAASLHHLKF